MICPCYKIYFPLLKLVTHFVFHLITKITKENVSKNRFSLVLLAPYVLNIPLSESTILYHLMRSINCVKYMNRNTVDSLNDANLKQMKNIRQSCISVAILNIL